MKCVRPGGSNRPAHLTTNHRGAEQKPTLPYMKLVSLNSCNLEISTLAMLKQGPLAIRTLANIGVRLQRTKKSSHAGCSIVLRYQKWLTFLFYVANIRCHASHVNRNLRRAATLWRGGDGKSGKVV
ncbi:hypothetical protein [Duganella sp. Leaf126]|uniref:hypothetical protein n=1 Tax=Duganella sp. Leaf126 TaxID=1736266 RepID=UPI0012E267F8|nr:hypothetical protein [Duganella sp. Leaf126]